MKKIVPIILAFLTMLVFISAINATEPGYFTIPNGLVYQLKIGPVPFELPELAEEIPTTSVQIGNGVVYYAGIYRSFYNADSIKRHLNNEGFYEVKVVAFFNYNPISLLDALTLQENKSGLEADPELLADTKAIQNEMCYKVQFGESGQQLSWDKLPESENISFEIMRTGEFVYTAGRFSSHLHASKKCRELEERGLENAKVVAYLNWRRIEMEEEGSYSWKPAALRSLMANVDW